MVIIQAFLFLNSISNIRSGGLIVKSGQDHFASVILLSQGHWLYNKYWDEYVTIIMQLQ